MSDAGMKRNHFHQANLRLVEGIALYKPNDDLQRDGIIQRFDFTFELAWKTLKDLFYKEGLTGLNSPKTILREAFSSGLIKDQDLWLLMLDDRNSTTHIYEERMAMDICERIIRTHQRALAELERAIEKRA